jgi:PhnB protein
VAAAGGKGLQILVTAMSNSRLAVRPLLASFKPSKEIYMARPAANPIPEGFHSLTPLLVCKGAVEAIEFYKKAFGAIEQTRLPGPDGSIIHATLRIGDSPIMLTDECPQHGAFGPKHLGGSSVTVHLSVADADAAAERAAAAGAKVVMPVTEMFWGARYGVLQDPFGHSWSIGTQVRDLTPEEIGAAMQEQFCMKATAAA